MLQQKAKEYEMFENIKIEKDVPVPENIKSKNAGLWKHLADTMKVGDSVFLKNPPKNAKGKLSVLTRLYAYKPKKFACQPEKDGARLWRIQ